MRGYRPPYDENKYVQYYLNQAGSGLPGYEGSSTQYGAGIGGMFRSLFKARPHQTRISRNFYARYACKMLLDHFVSKMVKYAQYAPYAPTSLA